jgi:quinol monooxygenase YgiN
MVILRFKIHSKPENRDELMAALAEIISPARATEGVITFNIARVLLDSDAFIATAVYEDGPALERQESQYPATCPASMQNFAGDKRRRSR